MLRANAVNCVVLGANVLLCRIAMSYLHTHRTAQWPAPVAGRRAPAQVRAALAGSAAAAPSTVEREPSGAAGTALQVEKQGWQQNVRQAPRITEAAAVAIGRSLAGGLL